MVVAKEVLGKMPAHLIRPGDVIRTPDGDTEVVKVEQGQVDLLDQLALYTANQDVILRHRDAPVSVVELF